MPKGELIDSHVSEHHCKLAVEALHSHETKKEQTRQEKELLPGKEQNVWLIVTVKKIQAHHKFKPIKIPIVHPLIDPRTTPVCLITKDPQRQYKDLLESHGIKFISRVVGIEKLKGKFKPFEARRMLLKENGMFLADQRIIPILPKLLGVKWFEAKKQPIPVCLTRKDLKGELERAISSTYMNQNNGTCTSIKISTLSQKPSKILANLKAALPVIVKNIKGGWDNIQSFHIKTNSSVSLPIWSCNLDENEGGRWDGLAVVTDEEVDDLEEEDDDAGMDVDKVKDAKKEKTLGKKRPSKEQDEDEETEKPKKKAKGAEGKAISEQPKEKRKALVKDSPPPASSPPAKSGKLAAADIDGISKPKKRKASLVAGSESALTLASSSAPKPPKKSSTTTDLADAADLPPSKETKRKRKGVKSAAIVDPAPPIHETPEADAQSTARRKKPQQEAFDQQVPERRVSSQVIPTIDEAIADPPQKKRKPRTSIAEPKVLESKEPDTPKKSKAAATATAPPRAYSPAVPVVTDELGDKEKKPKRKDKKAKSADEELKSTTDIGPADVSLSKAELKLKRSAGVGEKKKDKVVKAKGGKSVKDGIIGKKVAQG